MEKEGGDGEREERNNRVASDSSLPEKEGHMKRYHHFQNLLNHFLSAQSSLTSSTYAISLG